MITTRRPNALFYIRTRPASIPVPSMTLGTICKDLTPSTAPDPRTACPRPTPTVPRPPLGTPLMATTSRLSTPTILRLLLVSPADPVRPIPEARPARPRRGGSDRFQVEVQLPAAASSEPRPAKSSLSRAKFLAQTTPFPALSRMPCRQSTETILRAEARSSPT